MFGPFTEKKEFDNCHYKKADYILGIDVRGEIRMGKIAYSFGGWELLDYTVLGVSEVQYYYYLDCRY